VSAVTDHYALRTEAERIVGEDRVPAEVLERLVADYGDGEHAGPPTRTDWLGHRAAMLFVVAVRRVVDRRRPVLPAALRLDGAAAIEELFNAAHDSELAMLDEVVERAGLGWKCQVEVGGFPCQWMNVGTAVCGGCSAGEAQGKEEPDG